MPVFSDPYLAESAGYNTGHALGIAQGRMQAATRAAQARSQVVREANDIIANKNAIIEDLTAKNANLAAQNANLRSRLELQQEQAVSLRADYENMYKAFVGAVAIGNPAIKGAIKLMNYEQKMEMAREFVVLSEYWQTPEYVRENGLPTRQPLIKQYMPDAVKIFIGIRDEMRQRKARAKAEAEVEPAFSAYEDLVMRGVITS